MWPQTLWTFAFMSSTSPLWRKNVITPLHLLCWSLSVDRREQWSQQKNDDALYVEKPIDVESDLAEIATMACCHKQLLWHRGVQIVHGLAHRARCRSVLLLSRWVVKLDGTHRREEATCLDQANDEMGMGILEFLSASRDLRSSWHVEWRQSGDAFLACSGSDVGCTRQMTTAEQWYPSNLIRTNFILQAFLKSFLLLKQPLVIQ